MPRLSRLVKGQIDFPRIAACSDVGNAAPAARVFLPFKTVFFSLKRESPPGPTPGSSVVLKYRGPDPPYLDQLTFSMALLNPAREPSMVLSGTA